MDGVIQMVLVDSASIGAGIAVAMQVIKILPESWLDVIFGDGEEQKKLRVQLAVFAISLASVLYRSVQGGLFNTLDWTDVSKIVAMLSFTVGTAYTSYQAIISRLAEKMPKVFKM